MAKLLSPAGNFTALKAAIDNGADEIYFGVQGFNMRANAKNFKQSDIKIVVKLCHDNNVKAFLAINIIIYENELLKLKKVLKKAKDANIDAIIAWDMSVVSVAEKLKIPIHLSTQCSISNYESLKYYKQKIKTLERVVLARECALEQIKSIIKKIKKDKLNIEIETFVHGAMCISVSGRCFMSQELFGRSANRGECIQPCRRKYDVYSDNEFKLKDPEEKKEMLLGQDYVMSPKDICTLSFIDQLIDAGIVSFKIEGRNRNPEYVATTTACYRTIIDYYNEYKYKIKRNNEEKKDYQQLKNKLIKRLKTVYNRDFSDGYFMGKPINEWCKVYGSKSIEHKQYIGKVTNYFAKIGVAEIRVESFSVSKNDEVYFQGSTTGVFRQKIPDIHIENDINNEVNNELKSNTSKVIKKAHKGQLISIKVNKRVRKNDEVYLIVKK